MAEAGATEASDGAEIRTLPGLFRYFLGLGSFGFGGPIALAGYMHRDLVEKRRWYTEAEYQQGLAISQTMPGPLAAQLAMWLGYLERGSFGAFVVSLPFVVPAFLFVTALAAVYAHYQGLSQVQSIFFGVGPAVMAIIAIAAYKLARTTNKDDPILWSVAVIVCVVTAATGAEIIWLFLGACLFGTIYYGGGIPRIRTRLRGSALLPLATVKGFAWLGQAPPSERWRSSSQRQAHSPSGRGWLLSRSSSTGSSKHTIG